MILKRLILVLIMSLLVAPAKSQYHRMAKEGREWYVQSSNSLWPGVVSVTNIYKIQGDSLINNKNYLLVYWHFRSYIDSTLSIPVKQIAGYLEEDTITGRVRVYKSYPLSNNPAVINYDMSMQKGDSIVFQSGFGRVYDFYWLADSIYYLTDFRGINRKVIKFVPTGKDHFCENAPPRNFVTLIEGIGPFGHIVSPEYCGGSGPHYSYQDLACVYDDSVKIFGDTVQHCNIYAFNINESFTPKSQARLYPNPANDILTIESKTEIKSIQIISSRGEIVLDQYHENDQLSIAHLKPGFYLILVNFVNNNRSSLKFTKI